MNFTITGNETADQLIKQLVGLRHYARRTLKVQDVEKSQRSYWQRMLDNAPAGASKALAMAELANLDEHRLQIKSAVIEIGGYTMALSRALDQKASREAMFDTLNVGAADRRSDMVLQHGDCTANLIFGLNLENSGKRPAKSS